MSFQGSKEIMFDRVCTWRKWVLAIVVGVLATFNAARAGYAQGTWTALTILPSAMEGMTVGGVGNTIVGGYGGASTGDTNQTFLYNIANNSWSSGAPGPLPARSEAAYGGMPHSRSDLTAVAHGGKSFLFGGCTGTVSTPSVTSEVDMYDPQTNTWTTGLAAMPTARTSLAAGHSGNKVYAIGGWDGVSPLSVNEVYDIASNPSSTNTPMPTAPLEARVHSHGSPLYIV